MKKIKKIFFKQLACTGLIFFFMAGYAAADISSSEMRIVKAAVGNLFTQPSIDASIIDILKKGDLVTLVVREGEWYIARLRDDRLGWVHQSLFVLPKKEEKADKPEDETKGFDAILKIMGGRVREAPAFQSAVKFVLKKGDRVKVTSEQAGWYFISLEDSRNGWAYHTLFDRLPEKDSLPTKKADATPVLFQAAVKIASGRVREAPSLKSAIKFTVKRGSIVSVTHQTDNWYFIRQEDGKKGWSHKSLFSKDLPKIITDIRFEFTPEGSENVVFVLNGLFHPKTFALEEDQVPKVVCDFSDTIFSKNIKSLIPVNGQLVKQIRTGLDYGKKSKARVVMDLTADQQYNVSQFLYQKTHLYTLTFKTQQDKKIN